MVPQAPTLPGEGVILLGADSQIGLSVIRELGEHDVPVYAISKSADGVGLYSRYLRMGFIHRERDEHLLALLREIAVEHRAPYVMTVSERDIAFLNDHRDSLAGLRLLIPDASAMAAVVDKQHIYDIAQSLGLQVPKAIAVNPDGTVSGVEELRYPVILKWSNPATIMPDLRAHGLPFHKAEYCHSADELREALERYDVVGRYPLIQGYCPGHGLGHMIFMHNGRALLRFQHRRVHEWPPEGGYSTLCESLPTDANAPLMAQSVELLRAIGWEGPAMVEYRYEPEADSAVLMEINGRFWGSLPLAYHAGARFAWLLYQQIGRGQEVPDAASYQPGLRCKFVLPDLKRLLRLLFARQRIQDRTLVIRPLRELWLFLCYPFGAGNRYYILSVSDPRPAIHECRLLLRRLLPGRRDR